MNEQLLLYDCAEAPSARRARMFIAEKGRSIPKINIDIRAGDHLRAEYLSINPTGLVPALRLASGEIITENDGIAAYLEAIWPKPSLLGEDAIERGRIAQWNARVELEGLLPLAAFLRNSLPAFAGRATPGVGSFEQIPELAVRSRSQVATFLGHLDNNLRLAPFVAGRGFSLADITAITFIDLWEIAQQSMPHNFKYISKWSTVVRRRRAYRAANE